MIADDLMYLLLLLFSIGAGPLIRKSSADVQTRQNLSTVFGLILGFASTGYHLIHALISTFVNVGILFLCPKKYCHVTSFIFNFSYLGLFRLTHYVGLPSPPPHANAMQMILTLKMIGLAFEIQHLWKLRQNQSNENSAELKYCSIPLTPVDVFYYAFCHAGILIGPYYKYRTYYDMFHAPYIDHIPLTEMLKKRICVVPFYGVLFLISDYLFPLQYAASDEIQQASLLYRIFYCSPLFFTFRMRIYIGFILGECACIMAGLGLYPAISKPEPGVGPTDYATLQDFLESEKQWEDAEYSHKTVHNIDELKSEFKPTIREGIRHWNMTVQYWLAIFVYRKAPFAKPVRMVLAMLTSAYWHGVHPGYYLCLCSAPFFLMAEAQMEKAFKSGASPLQQTLFDVVCWFFKMQSFAYMGVAFLLLRVDTTLVYWRSIYFIGHILMAAFFCLGYCWQQHRKSIDAKVTKH